MKINESSVLNTNSDFSFSDLVDIPDLQELVNHLSKLAGCGLAVLDVNGNFLVSAGLQKICTCIHRVHPETKKHCIESDRFIEQNLKTKKPITYRCKNGLWDVAYPIFIEEKHLANIFFGQFFFDDEEINTAFFEQQASEYGFDKTEYLSYVNEVPVISRKKADTLNHFITVLAHMLTKTGYSNLLIKKEKIDELQVANTQLKEIELQLRELNSTKDKFFSIIGHDLRNPFGVLISSSELLSIYLEKNDLAKSKAKARMILKAANQGYALLENLLIWSKTQIEGIKFDPRKLNLKLSVLNCIANVEDQAMEKSIKIINEIPDDLTLEADENLMDSVFRNLITNAIKFTPNGGSITIKSKTDKKMVELAVIDTGIGIPEKHQNLLFRIDANFLRAGTKGEASTGLGLILCKEFVEKHNGKIWVKSEVNKGSEFRFTLPYIQN